MHSWFLLLIPALPAASAAWLALSGGRLSYNAISATASASVGASLALVLAFCGAGIFGSGQAVDFSPGAWIATQGFQAGFHLRLDSASLCMCLLVTFFGFLITVYSVGYMRHDHEPAGGGRFFASLNLFVASMLTLVLSDNLVLMFLGWEGVGLCSYLLIGHYWKEDGVPLAAYRAFFVNRIGDVLFLLGVFSVFAWSGTVSLSELASRGPEMAAANPGKAGLTALLLLGGAFAKSAQAPLHVWLADAMAGPTPVSALIHAATMVTAGVYLLMRLDWLYSASPEARLVIAVCALLTLVLGALMALTQTDIKKILAYSTLSNLALMFLALSAKASGAAMLHLFGHAFFKALLFLAAGSVIMAAHHEQDVRKLRGVLKKLPVTNAAFWVGCIGGAGLIPYLSAGFFSKEAVLGSLEEAEFSGWGFTLSGRFVHAVVLAVECLSALYLFRLLGFLRSDGDSGHAAASDHGHEADSHGKHGGVKETSPAIKVVLGILVLAAPLFGIFSASPSFGGKGSLYSMLTGGAAETHGPSIAHALPFLLLNMVLAGLCYFVYSHTRRREAMQARLAAWQGGVSGPLARKFYFDDLYAVAIIAPLKGLARLAKVVLENIFISVLTLAGWAGKNISMASRRWQTGKAHQYAVALFLATFLLIFYLAGK